MIWPSGLCGRLHRCSLALVLALALATSGVIAPARADGEPQIQIKPQRKAELVVAVALTSLLIPVQNMLIWDTPEGRVLANHYGMDLGGAALDGLVVLALMAAVIQDKRRALRARTLVALSVMLLSAQFSIPPSVSR